MIESSRVRVPAGATGYFFTPGTTYVLILISVSVPPPCYCKNPGHSAKSAGGRLQLNKHAPYVCGFERSDTVNLCMVVWGTQILPRDGISLTWHHATTKRRSRYTISVDIIKCTIKILLIQNHMRYERSETVREQSLLLYKSDQ